MYQIFMTRCFWFGILGFMVSELTGQTLVTETMELSALTNRISRDSVEHHLRILSADDMEGREAGYPGNEKAARYLAEKLNLYGFQTPPRTRGYFQPFPVYRQTFKNASLEIGQHSFENGVDFYALPAENPNLPSFTASDIVYLGYGVTEGEYADWGAGDLTNKVVMIDAGYPAGFSGWSGHNRRLASAKAEAAGKAGVRALLVVSENFSEEVKQNNTQNGSVTMSLKHAEGPNIIYISPRVAARIMKGQEDKVAQYQSRYRREAGSSQKNIPSPVTIRKSVELALHKVTEYQYIPNVVGFLPGKDPVLKHEILVLSAHFDHLGVQDGEIYNGADDDGSGVSSILEIGRVISELEKEDNDFPRRSLLVLFANAEEKGLLGSAFYTENPLFPLKNTITNLNVDMIGRRDENHADNPYYVYVIGSDKLSLDLHEVNEAVNDALTNLELDYRYNDDADPNRFYYRSDHYNFAKNDIPVIFYFTGVHEDYHQPTDTVEKIEFGKMMTITKLIFGTAWELLNMDHRPALD